MVDELGAPVSAVPISTVVEYNEVTASRVKGAGSAYLTRYNYSWVEVARCDQSSGGEGVSCDFTPPKPGRYRISSSITDTMGRPHRSEILRWGTGVGQVLWETPPGHHLSIEPESAEYRVGETAKFLIQNPFPGAEALFTEIPEGTRRIRWHTASRST